MLLINGDEPANITGNLSQRQRRGNLNKVAEAERSETMSLSEGETRQKTSLAPSGPFFMLKTP